MEALASLAAIPELCLLARQPVVITEKHKRQVTAEDLLVCTYSLYLTVTGSWILDCECSIAHTAVHGTQGGILGTEVILVLLPGLYYLWLMKKTMKTKQAVTSALLLNVFLLSAAAEDFVCKVYLCCCLYPAQCLLPTIDTDNGYILVSKHKSNPVNSVRLFTSLNYSRYLQFLTALGPRLL